MTEVLTLTREFFASPMGTLLLVVLGGLATYMASTLKAKGEASKQIEASRAEAAQLLNDREAQNLADREAIRQLFLKGQARIDVLVSANDALEQRLNAAQAESHQAKTSAAACTVQIADLKGQIDKAQAELKAKTVELEDRLVEITGLRTQNDVLISSNYDLMQANEVLQVQMKARNKELEEERAKNGHLQEEVTQMQQQIDTLKEQVRQLQAKVGTGELDPSKVPDTDPATATAPLDGKPSSESEGIP